MFLGNVSHRLEAYITCLTIEVHLASSFRDQRIAVKEGRQKSRYVNEVIAIFALTRVVPRIFLVPFWGGVFYFVLVSESRLIRPQSESITSQSKAILPQS